MALPPWNCEWEKPGPLRGRRGWALPHYINLAIAALLAAISVGPLVPAFGRAHEKSVQVRGIDYRGRILKFDQLDTSDGLVPRQSTH
jgi:hypothetical protein